MKYIKSYIIIIFITLLLCGCVNLDNFVAIEEHNYKISELEGRLEEVNSKNKAKDVEISGLQKEADTLGDSLDLTKEELEKYQNLINNLNSLLKNVYYGYTKNENYILDGFTAFSLNYKNKNYIITAGHCIENEYGKFYNFKFKANFSDQWIYPELLAYKNYFYGNMDYAVFYSDKVIDGLNYDLNDSYPRFTLGNMEDNVLKEFFISNLIEGESGSAIIDIDGEVMGIATGGYVDIDLVIKALDNLK